MRIITLQPTRLNNNYYSNCTNSHDSIVLKVVMFEVGVGGGAVGGVIGCRRVSCMNDSFFKWMNLSHSFRSGFMHQALTLHDCQIFYVGLRYIFFKRRVATVCTVYRTRFTLLDSVIRFALILWLRVWIFRSWLRFMNDSLTWKIH